jgi:hypothetical protein
VERVKEEGKLHISIFFFGIFYSLLCFDRMDLLDIRKAVREALSMIIFCHRWFINYDPSGRVALD